jgi:diguanylate cyclase (GGDEF)-like protein
MIIWVILVVALICMVCGNIVLILNAKHLKARQKNDIALYYDKLLLQESALHRKVEAMELSMSRQFSFYDLIRKIDSIIDKRTLFTVLLDELKHMSFVDEAIIATEPPVGEWLEFEFNDNEEECLFVKAVGNDAIQYVGLAAQLAGLSLERISLYGRLQQLSIYDALTTVYNRRYFDIRYGDEFTRAKKYKHNLAVLMVDVDYFKKVNDSYGHLAGDAVLREVAVGIKESIREVDFVARLGGEEFVVVLAETGHDGALMVAERIRTKIAGRTIQAFDEQVHISVSIGVAVYPDNTVNADMLIEAADKFLYKAKEAGRNCVVSA